MPALSRAGSRWTVSRGNRVVFRMENTPGAVGWKRERPEPSFIRGEVLDAREEARLHPLVARAKNLRDLVRRLERAGYGVGADAETPAGG